MPLNGILLQETVLIIFFLLFHLFSAANIISLPILIFYGKQYKIYNCLIYKIIMNLCLYGSCIPSTSHGFDFFSPLKSMLPYKKENFCLWKCFS